MQPAMQGRAWFSPRATSPVPAVMCPARRRGAAMMWCVPSARPSGAGGAGSSGGGGTGAPQPSFQKGEGEEGVGGGGGLACCHGLSTPCVGCVGGGTSCRRGLSIPYVPRGLGLPALSLRNSSTRAVHSALLAGGQGLSVWPLSSYSLQTLSQSWWSGGRKGVMARASGGEERGEGSSQDRTREN